LNLLTNIRRVVPSPILKAYRKYVSDNRYRTTDVFFLGYPRSGTTWLRFMLGRYIQLLSGERTLRLYGHYDWLGRCEKSSVGPPMNFSHGGIHWFETSPQEITPEKFVAPFLNKQIVLIVRYPLDVLVSNWAYDKNISGKEIRNLSNYLDDPIVGLDRYFHYHNLWAATRKQFSDFLLCRYEDLAASPRFQMMQLVEFLSLSLDHNKINVAIDYASLQNMKRIQSNHGEEHVRNRKSAFFRVGNPDNPESHHVRRGKVGGYRDYLNRAEVNHYERLVKTNLDAWFGYQTAPGGK
jgi:hypothetical protein